MSFREKLAERSKERYALFPHANDNATKEIEDEETTETSEYFGLDNARKYPTCLDLRLANGSFKAIPYSYIVEISFEPSEGIEIITTNKKITVSGRNLHRLYDYLTAYRVKYIKAHIGNDIADGEALFVNVIKIEDT